MNVEVTSCNDCPFLSRPTYEDSYCNHPESDVYSEELTDFDKKILPIACPLKKGAVTVKIKQ